MISENSQRGADVTRVGIIHTSPATVEILKGLAAELLPGTEVVNILDDSILPQLAQNGGNLAEVEDRLVQYARIAEQVGVEAVLEACSSVGELVPRMQAAVHIPVVRIDTAMAEEAVRRASRISSSLRSTLFVVRTPRTEERTQDVTVLRKRMVPFSWLDRSRRK